MLECTVCLLLCRETQSVLLLRKDRTDFAGKYNGVGGKLEPTECAEECALREIKEEAGADVQGRLLWLGTLMHPRDCVRHDPDGVTLYFYGAEVSAGEVHQQPGETEKLRWFLVEDLLNLPTNNEVLAGDGDLQFFINEAVRNRFHWYC